MQFLMVKLERFNSKRSNKVPQQIEFIVKRALGGQRGNNWRLDTKRIVGPTFNGTNYRWNIVLVFGRFKGQNNPDIVERQANDIISHIRNAGCHTKFREFPYNIVEHNVIQNGGTLDTAPAPLTPLEMAVTANGTVPGVDPVTVAENDNNDNDTATPTPPRRDRERDAVEFEAAVPLEEIDIPEVLITGTNEEIENHPCFAGIYGRTSHIRVIASSLKSFKESNGARRNHIVMHGLPACAKSKIVNGFKEVLGGPTSGAFVSLNADSTTKAGIETLFLRRLTATGIPPFIFVEELEKTNEAVLTIWLGMLDERCEIRKVNARQQEVVRTKILCVSTVNDKTAFDRMMGGRPGRPGALSSRFVKQLYVPRPDAEIMRRILLRDIELYGGNPEWADKCIELSNEIGTNDPRMILGFLDGQDRLITGEYQEDILKIFKLEKKERKEHLGEFVGIDPADEVVP